MNVVSTEIGWDRDALTRPKGGGAPNARVARVAACVLRARQEAFFMFGSLERRVMQLGNWALSLTCGSMGVFTLWYSIDIPRLLPYAAGFLAIGGALEAANHLFLSE